jgi:hypothetical protein
MDTTNTKLNKMREWIIKNWSYSYDSVLFGIPLRHLRAVNTLIVLICAAGLYNLLTPGFDWVQGLVFLPFLVILLGGSKLFLRGRPRFYELDWEQKYQVLQRGETSVDRKFLYSKLSKKYEKKYKGEEKFVEAFRSLFPALVILLTVIIYLIFGFVEEGFSSQRFF